MLEYAVLFSSLQLSVGRDGNHDYDKMIQLRSSTGAEETKIQISVCRALC